MAGKWKRNNTKIKNNSILSGMLSGAGLLVFYLAVVSLFQSFEFAVMNLHNFWYLILPLSVGFGIQIGLYASIRHSAILTGTIAGTGGISAGSMLACCSHFLLNIIPIAGISGLAVILVKYQPVFLGMGIVSNILGISLMIKHKKEMKGGTCHGE